jgi:hypothetical protein
MPEGTDLILTNMILGQMSSPFNIYPMIAIKHSTLSHEVLVLKEEKRKKERERKKEGERRGREREREERGREGKQKNKRKNASLTMN